MIGEMDIHFDCDKVFLEEGQRVVQENEDKPVRNIRKNFRREVYIGKESNMLCFNILLQLYR